MTFKKLADAERERREYYEKLQPIFDNASHLQKANIILHENPADLYREYPNTLLMYARLEALVSIAESLKELTKKP